MLDADHPEKAMETANQKNCAPVAFTTATVWKRQRALDGRPSGEHFETQQEKPKPSEAEHGQFQDSAWPSYKQENATAIPGRASRHGARQSGAA